MSSTTVALRAGVARGVIELRQSFAGAGFLGHLLWPVGTLVAIYFLRDDRFQSSDYTVGTLMLPSVLGMFVALGMMLVIQYLAADREDGTLLRAKATPHGIRCYLVGKLVTVSLTTLVYLVIIVVPGVLVVDDLDVRAGTWATIAWVLVLGLVGTQALGAILGSLIKTPRGVGYVSLPVLALMAISGIFYPLAAFPGWLQAIAQVFPMYWLGLGMRSALLPPDAATVEVAESWRHLETAAVLGAWAVLGLLVAPIVLRRMARRESGSALERRHEMALRRAY